MTLAPSLAALSHDIGVLAAAAAPAAVGIAHKRRATSGFYLRPDVVATASEALSARRGETVALITDQGTMDGTVIGHDPSTDLALIRPATPGTALLAAVSPSLTLGQAALTVGRTQHGATATLGFVALVGGGWRSMRGGEIDQRIVVDARLMRSAEGGAVVDSAGGLLGMAVFGPRRRVLVIPVATIERVASELMAHGRIRQGYLGVAVQAVTLPADNATTNGVGLMVTELDASGPAAAAGMMRGDIITALGGVAPTGVRGLMRLLPAALIGQAKPVAVIRAGQVVELTVTIGEHVSGAH